MDGFNPVENKAEIKIPKGYKALTEFKEKVVDDHGRAVKANFEGHKYKVLSVAEKKYSGAEMFGRGLLGTAMAITIVLLPLFFIKAVRDLFSDKSTLLYGRLITAAPPSPLPQAPPIPAKPYRLEKPPGIANPGSMCYFNSSIQMLFSTPEFRECIRKKDPAESPIIKAIHNLLNEYEKDGAPTRLLMIRIKELFNALKKKGQSEELNLAFLPFDSVKFNSQQDPMLPIGALVKAVGYPKIEISEVIKPQGYQQTEKNEQLLQLVVPTSTDVNLHNIIQRLKDYDKKVGQRIFNADFLEVRRDSIENSLKRQSTIIKNSERPYYEAWRVTDNTLKLLSGPTVKSADLKTSIEQLEKAKSTLQKPEDALIDIFKSSNLKVINQIDVIIRGFRSFTNQTTDYVKIIEDNMNNLHSAYRLAKTFEEDYRQGANVNINALCTVIEQKLREEIHKLDSSTHKDHGSIRYLQEILAMISEKVPSDVQGMINTVLLGEKKIDPVDRGDGKVAATKQTVIRSYPERLMIQMGRGKKFIVAPEIDGGAIGGFKDHRKLALPDDRRLRIGDWIYTIEGYIVHEGESVNSGHYWYGKLADGTDGSGKPIKGWLEVNDSRVEPMPNLQPRSIENAYILHLKRAERAVPEGE